MIDQPVHTNIAVLGGSANPKLAGELAERMGCSVGVSIERFPDGEIHVEVDRSVCGKAVAIVQPLGAPVGEHLIELVLLADACWRLGAASIAAVIPYLGYARHDRRSSRGEPLGCRVIADLLGTARFDRILAVDLHTASVEGFFRTKLDHLSAVPLLAEALRPSLAPSSVVVSPDLGGAKLAELYARTLGLPMAIVYKSRLGPREVRAERVVGDVRGLRPIIVDDIISTGGTIAAASERLLAEGAIPELTVVASHPVFAPKAIERLARLPLERLITTDSLPISADLPFDCGVTTLVPLLAAELAVAFGCDPASVAFEISATAAGTPPKDAA